MHIEHERDGFVVSTDPARIDVTAVHAYLARSHWAAGISRELVAKSIARSLCFGLFHADRQIGFARVITDEATFAYLADVYVLEEYRRRGLATWMIERVVNDPRLQGLRRFVLVTRDAHGLYAKFGFTAVAHPERYMEKWQADIYEGSRGDR
jgi:GNAT superfamily N-acetyltransferase